MMNYEKHGDCRPLIYSFPAFNAHYRTNPTSQANYLFIVQVNSKRPEENLILVKKGDDEAVSVHKNYSFFNRANLRFGDVELRH